MARVRSLEGRDDLQNEFVVIAGDLNDVPDGESLGALTRHPELYNAIEALAVPERWTYHYRGKNQQLDYLLLSRPLRSAIKKVTVERRGMFGVLDRGLFTSEDGTSCYLRVYVARVCAPGGRGGHAMEQERRTYIYYSDDKILQWKQQVPQSRWERATRRVTEMSGTAFSVGGKIGFGRPEEDPILRSLQTMWIDLADEGLVGTVDEPSQYFYGRLVFYYGIFQMVNPPVFFLVGATDRTIVGLGGSAKHVRGLRGQQIPVADSAQAVVMEPDVASLIHRASEGRSERPPDSPSLGPNDDIRALHVALLYRNWQFWEGRKMEFEVLARQELLAPVSPPHVEAPQNVLIGSPVFVAQV